MFASKFSHLLNEPYKIIAILISLIMTSLTFKQIITFFYLSKIHQTHLQPASKVLKEVKLTDKSPLFIYPLFGKYVSSPTKADIKESALELELVGIMYSSDPKKSQILIKDKTNTEKIYFLGDTLVDGAIIKRITQTGIIVWYRGDLESLSLPKNKLLFAKPSMPLKNED